MSDDIQSMSLRWKRRILSLAAITAVMAGCSAPTTSSAVNPSSSNALAPSASPTPDPMANPVIDGRFAVAGNERSLYMTCWGHGDTTIVLETGIPSDGLVQFERSLFASLLAAQTRTCAYDRAGVGQADAPPNRPRELEEVTDDLHALLAAAGIKGPIVLAGSSGGGMIVSFYASRFPKGVMGVVLLDVPAPSATLSLEEAPELAWDSSTNPEHLDIVPGFENRLAKERHAFRAPLIVVTAAGGQSDVKDQEFWLDWSPDASQIELEGAHDILNSQPQAVADQVLSLLDR